MIYLYNPPKIFDALSYLDDVELFDPSKEYTESDVIICPVKWELWSVESIMVEDYDEALKNKNFEHVSQGIRTNKINYLIRRYGAKILLYQEWECRNLNNYHRQLEIFTRKYLKMPYEDVYYSMSDYIGHMKCIKGNIIPFDWPFAREQSMFDSTNIVARNPKYKYPIISLNYRSTAERYAYCFFMQTRHKEKFMFSYLQDPVGDIEIYKKPLRSAYTAKNIEDFNSMIPRFLDGDNPDQHQVLTIHDYLYTSYLNVAFETNWEGLQSQAEQVSEKTYKSIKIGKPFLLFTTKGGILKHLKKLGFKSFSPFLCEEYDNEKLPYMERFEHLLSESDRICNMSDSELAVLEKNLESIVRYNLEHLENGQVPNIFEIIQKNKRPPFLRLLIMAQNELISWMSRKK